MALRTELSIQLKPTLTKVVGNQTPEEILEFFRQINLLTGVVIDQADRLYYAKPTIAGTTTLSLDLAGGGLKDVLGDTFDPARLKLILVNAPLADCPNVINLNRPAAGV